MDEPETGCEYKNSPCLSVATGMYTPHPNLFHKSKYAASKGRGAMTGAILRATKQLHSVLKRRAGKRSSDFGRGQAWKEIYSDTIEYTYYYFTPYSIILLLLIAMHYACLPCDDMPLQGSKFETDTKHIPAPPLSVT